MAQGENPAGWPMDWMDVKMVDDRQSLVCPVSASKIIGLEVHAFENEKGIETDVEEDN